jgi:hypothetical protein
LLHRSTHTLSKGNDLPPSSCIRTWKRTYTSAQQMYFIYRIFIFGLSKVSFIIQSSRRKVWVFEIQFFTTFFFVNSLRRKSIQKVNQLEFTGSKVKSCSPEKKKKKSYFVTQFHLISKAKWKKEKIVPGNNLKVDSGIWFQYHKKTRFCNFANRASFSPRAVP